MGINTYQIATEGNIESNSNYKGYLDSTTGNKKCITVNRLLKGLLSTSNTPTYNISNTNGFATTYQLKHWGYSATTNISLSAGYLVPNTSQIISTNATNYSGYPFSTGTGVLAINSNYTTTINATITVTCVSHALASSDDGVSTASLDFDNPADDTESNTNGQEPTLAGNMSRITICNNQGPTDTGCICHTGVTANLSCPTNCAGDGVCLPDEYKYSTTVRLSLQIYTGTVDGTDEYTTICSGGESFSLKINSNASASITLNIPTRYVFNISGTPTTTFKFRLLGTFAGVGTVGTANIFTTITATIPRIYFTVYNPGPRCLQYNHLSTIYSLY